MAPTPVTRKKLELSEEAQAALQTVMPLKGNDWEILGADNRLIAALDFSAHDTEIAAFIAALVNAALTPAAKPEPACPYCGHRIVNLSDWRCTHCGRYFPHEGTRFCDYEGCDGDVLPGFDFCAAHQDEYDANIRAAIDPENNTELSQLITTQLESAQLAAQYAAANDARREA